MPKTPSFLFPAGAGLILMALLALGLFTLQAEQLRSHPPAHNDLNSYYAGAVLARTGAASPYDPAAQRDVIGTGADRLYPFLYPPATLIVFAPLAQLTPAQAYLLSLILNVVLLTAVITGYALLAWHLSGSPGCGLLTGGLLTVSQTFTMTMATGQINALIALALLAYTGLAGSRRPALTGLCLTLASIFKLTPYLNGLALLLARDWRSLLWTGLWTSGLIALSLFLYPPGYWPDWAQAVLTQGYGRIPEGLTTIGTPSNLSLNGVLTRLLSPVPGYWSQPLWMAPDLIRPVGLSLLALLGGLTLLPAARCRHQPVMGVALTVWFAFLTAPVSWFHHLTFAMVAPVCFAAFWWRCGAWIRLSVVIGCQLTVELANDILLISPLTACLPFLLYLLCGALFAQTAWQQGQKLQSAGTGSGTSSLTQRS